MYVDILVEKIGFVYQEVVPSFILSESYDPTGFLISSKFITQSRNQG